MLNLMADGVRPAKMLEINVKIFKFFFLFFVKSRTNSRSLYTLSMFMIQVARGGFVCAPTCIKYYIVCYGLMTKVVRPATAIGWAAICAIMHGFKISYHYSTPEWGGVPLVPTYWRLNINLIFNKGQNQPMHLPQVAKSL